MMDLDEDSCYRLLFSRPPELASRGVGLVVRHNVMKSLKSLILSQIGYCVLTFSLTKEF